MLRGQTVSRVRQVVVNALAHGPRDFEAILGALEELPTWGQRNNFEVLMDELVREGTLVASYSTSGKPVFALADPDDDDPWYGD